MGLLLKNGQAYINNELHHKDVLVEGNKITKIEDHIYNDDHQVIDLNNKIISSGFIDVHVHLREPGFEHKEDIKTGTKAASRGGFTTICAMPNTNPVPDTVEVVNNINKLIEEKAEVRVKLYGSITKGEKHGSELVDFDNLSNKVCAFSNDGYGVQDSLTMYKAMLKAKENNQMIVAHCEDEALTFGGVIHAGRRAQELGLKGHLGLTEYIHIARDIALSMETGAAYHVCHISTKESVALVRDAKRRGVNVTAEVTPHHLLLTEDDVYTPDEKMNPPLRSEVDHQALIDGILDGTIDFIATDHAPHSKEEKDKGMDKAPNGIVGIETSFPLVYTYFTKHKLAKVEEILSWFTNKPGERFNLGPTTLKVGEIADITITDLNLEKTIDRNNFLSKGKNTPFDGYVCKGWPIITIVDGKIVYREV